MNRERRQIRYSSVLNAVIEGHFNQQYLIYYEYKRNNRKYENLKCKAYSRETCNQISPLVIIITASLCEYKINLRFVEHSHSTESVVHKLS